MSSRPLRPRVDSPQRPTRSHPEETDHDLPALDPCRRGCGRVRGDGRSRHRRRGVPRPGPAMSWDSIPYPRRAAPASARLLARGRRAERLRALAAHPELIGLLAITAVLNLWNLSINGW